LWNRRAVMQLVKVLFDIEMPIRTVGPPAAQKKCSAVDICH
jgi:hypothetical protein